MLLNAEYIRTSIGREHYTFYYKLVDTDYDKPFTIQCPNTASADDQAVFITDGILKFIYSEYKDSRQCVFFAIKKMYDNCGFQYSDEIIRKTFFYGRHEKVMEKILKPAQAKFDWDQYYATTGSLMTNNTTLTYANYNNTQTFSGTITLQHPLTYITTTVNIRDGY